MTAHRNGMRLALAVATLSGFIPSSHAAESDSAGAVAVKTVHVRRGPIAQPVQAYGIVAASASNLTTVNLPYIARILQIRVQPGETVVRGTPLLVVQADPAAVAAADQTRSAVTLAQGELARIQSLYDEGLATQSQLAAAKKARQDARQQLAVQDQMGLIDGPRIVLAPVDGVVLEVTATQGDQVSAGTAMLQIATGNTGKNARANVMLGVEPSDAAFLHPGDAVTLHGLSTALARTALTGRVVIVGASIDTQSQLVDIGANVPIAQTAFIPGTRVSARIATRTGVYWMIPRPAVLKDERGEYLFQVTPDHKAHRITVVTKVEDGDRYGVDGALDGALPVVVSGNYELQDGMAVLDGGGAAR